MTSVFPSLLLVTLCAVVATLGAWCLNGQAVRRPFITLVAMVSANAIGFVGANALAQQQATIDRSVEARVESVLLHRGTLPTTGPKSAFMSSVPVIASVSLFLVAFGMVASVWRIGTSSSPHSVVARTTAALGLASVAILATAMQLVESTRSSEVERRAWIVVRRV